MALIVVLILGGLLERRSRVSSNTRLIGRVEELTRETHASLCGIRADYRQRVQTLTSLLESTKDDPIMAFGLEIPRDQLESEIRSRQLTLTSLNILTCKTDTEEVGG